MTWAEILDALEASAAAFEATLADPEHAVEPAPLVLPAAAGPLPAGLRARADDVLGRLRAAEGELRARRDLLAQELALVSGGRTSAGARYVDTHA
jgi:hypothetical protein